MKKTYLSPQTKTDDLASGPLLVSYSKNTEAASDATVLGRENNDTFWDEEK